MKVWKSRPRPELRIVRVNENRQEYEFWLIETRCIGSATRAGTQTIIMEDGRKRVNLREAGYEYLIEEGKRDLAEEFYTLEGQPGVKVTGADLAASGQWPDFCEMRGIRPNSIEALKAEYLVNAREAHKLGLKVPGRE